MKNTSILNVLDAIGKALETKDGEIALLQYQLDSTKKALANAEARLEELRGLYGNTDNVEMPIRPEITA